MARGFLSGAIWGGALSLCVAGTASVMTGGRLAPVVADTAPVKVDAPALAPALGDGATQAPASDADLVQAGAPAVAAPDVETTTAATQAGADVPTQPLAGAASDLQTPEEATQSSDISVSTEAPVQPQVQATAPQVPQVETDTGLVSSPAESPAQPVAPSLPEDASLPSQGGAQAEDERPAIGQPAGSLVDRTEPQDGVQAPRPIDVFAASFEAPEDRPLMAIVLIDNGADLANGAAGLAALRSFPAPISFAIDASLADAAERMRAYRAEGFEVLAMLDLPTGATATDAEVTLNAVFSDMDQVVGVMEGVNGGVQGAREASDQLTQILADGGYGLVTQSKGLNTVQKLALRAGVPAASVFRDFDSAGQSPRTIRRFLDQAAFRAGQEGGVIMLGRLRAETISALLLWGLADRAERVALAPVSAVLKFQAGQ